jgi:hypothetical protein
MNLSKIRVGETYKNYKELCSILDEPIKTGKSKQLQLKDWERYFTYKKEGNKFVITEIFDQPKPKQDKRKEGRNETPYINLIEKLILDLLVQHNGKGNVFLSKNMLLKELRMINEDYIYYRNKRFKLSDFTGIPKIHIDEFYDTTDDTLTRNLERALNKLENQSLIFWSRAMTVCFIDTDINYNEYGEIQMYREIKMNDYGEKEEIYTPTSPYIKGIIHRKATDQEVKLILQIEEWLLNKYQCDSKADLYKKGIAEQFFDEVKEILFHKTNIAYYYKSYEIICNHEGILRKWKSLNDLLLKIDERKQYQNELNKNVIIRLNNNARKRHKKAKNININQYNDNNKQWLIYIRQDNDYIHNTKKLTDTLIKNDD